jgi:hypothetical protein
MIQGDLEHGLFWELKHYVGLAETLLAEAPQALSEYGLTVQDLNIWLMDQRDGMSLADIARDEYPRYWQAGGRRTNQMILSAVRRAKGRVKKFFNREGDEFRYPKRRKGKLEIPVFFTSYELACLAAPENEAPARSQIGKRSARKGVKVSHTKGHRTSRNKRRK